MKKPVFLLDITTLSQLRKDAHPCAYGVAMEELIAFIGASQDCLILGTNFYTL